MRSDAAAFLDRAFAGESSIADDVELELTGESGPKNVHLSYSSTPLRDDNGVVCGVFGACREITDQVLAEGHGHFMAELSDRLRVLEEAREVMAVAAATLGRHLGVG